MNLSSQSHGERVLKVYQHIGRVWPAVPTHNVSLMEPFYSEKSGIYTGKSFTIVVVKM